jgi:hypothetical protein
LADGNPQYDLSALLHTDTPATKAPMDRMDLTAPTAVSIGIASVLPPARVSAPCKQDAGVFRFNVHIEASVRTWQVPVDGVGGTLADVRKELPLKQVEFMFISFDGDMIPRFEEPYLRCRPVFTDGILIRILYVHSRAGPGDGSGARWP